VKPAYNGTATNRNVFPLREGFRLLQILGTVEVFP